MTTKFQTSLGIIEIGDTCYETYPCQHRVSIDGKPAGTRFITSIQELLIKAGRPDLAESCRSIIHKDHIHEQVVKQESKEVPKKET